MPADIQGEVPLGQERNNDHSEVRHIILTNGSHRHDKVGVTRRPPEKGTEKDMLF